MSNVDEGTLEGEGWEGLGGVVLLKDEGEKGELNRGEEADTQGSMKTRGDFTFAGITAGARLTGALLCVWVAGWMQAAPVLFTIDPERTEATLSGMAAGLPMVEQGPGSLTTRFQGGLWVELGEGSIRFPGGSAIDAMVNGDWSPKPSGESGTAPADFGAAASSGFLSGTAALREVILDLESEAPLELTGEEFDAAGLLFVFPEGSPTAFDYRITALFVTQAGRQSLSGNATNQIATVGSLRTDGGEQTLTIPVSATIAFGLLSEEEPDSALTIEGQLVATRRLEEDAVLRLRAVRVEQGEIVFEWDPEPDVTLEVERTTDLRAWVWIADVPVATATWRGSMAGGSAFYRVVKR